MAAVTYLFDTNIFLELLLDRERAGKVRQLILTLDPVNTPSPTFLSIRSA